MAAADQQIAAPADSEAEATPPLLFSFGAISDVQHADREDGHNYTRTKVNICNVMSLCVCEWVRSCLKNVYAWCVYMPSCLTCIT